jgi:hypothetical protein
MPRRRLPPQDSAWFGPVLNCALRDTLVLQALAGDRAALRQLLPALPADLPPAVRKAYRDAQLRQLASWLKGISPDISDHAAARILVAAGDSVATGADIGHRAPFGFLSLVERRQLRDAVGELNRLTGPSWPRERQMRSILCA